MYSFVYRYYHVVNVILTNCFRVVLDLCIGPRARLHWSDTGSGVMKFST